MPKVSVIMPTYNRGWIIQRAIKSVLGQSFNDFELIIIENGSTDDTRQVLSKFKDRRIVARFLKKNKGQVAGRNIGLKLAKGELIAYLDSDNLWYPEFLAVMTEELTADYVMAYSGQNMFLVSGEKTSLRVLARKVRNEEYNPARIIRGNFIDINTIVHRKSILETIGYFDETLKSLVDWDLSVRIITRYPFKVKHVDQVLGEYFYFLKQTATTITNSRLSDERLLRYFGIRKAGGDEGKIRAKVQELLQGTSD